MEKKRILVVDDEETIRIAMVTALKCEKYDIDVAKNGCQAIRYIDSILYDLVITDYSMPEMDGIELISIIQARYPGMPVILVTGVEAAETLVQNMTVLFFQKPFNIFELQDAVYNILNTADSRACRSK